MISIESICEFIHVIEKRKCILILISEFISFDTSGFWTIFPLQFLVNHNSTSMGFKLVSKYVILRGAFVSFIILLVDYINALICCYRAERMNILSITI